MRTLMILVGLLTAWPALAARPVPWTQRARATRALPGWGRALRNSALKQAQIQKGATLKRVPWTKLRRAATLATRSSYAPYSKVHVGAAGITDKGTIITGCNVENASYGLTNCAEGGMISKYVCDARPKGEKLVAVSIVAGDGKPLAPCGRCRQVLFEFGGKELRIDGGKGHRPVKLKTLLPKAFGPDDVLTRSDKH